MHTQLAKIFEMRNALLKRCNIKYYRVHEKVIINSSLAAQDFYFSGDLMDYDGCKSSDLLHDNLYDSLHTEYSVPYKSSDSRCVNAALVLDLARALRADIEAGILGKSGEIMIPERLVSSQVLQTFHNSEESGVPVTALKTMTPIAYRKFMSYYYKRKSR